jgi:hypothetical protein
MRSSCTQAAARICLRFAMNQQQTSLFAPVGAPQSLL